MTPSSNFIHSGRSRSHLPSCDPAARTKTAEEVRGDSWGGRWPGQDCGLAPQSIFRSRDKVALDNELSYYVIRRGIWPWHEIQIKIIKLIFRGRERRRRLLGASEIICTAFKYFNSLPSSEISNLRIWVIQQVQNIRTAVYCQSVSWFTVTLKRALKIHHIDWSNILLVIWSPPPPLSSMSIMVVKKVLLHTFIFAKFLYRH